MRNAPKVIKNPEYFGAFQSHVERKVLLVPWVIADVFSLSEERPFPDFMWICTEANRTTATMTPPIAADVTLCSYERRAAPNGDGNSWD